MTLYDDVGYTYDDPSLLYDGVVIGETALVVNGVNLTDYLADRSLNVRVATHGNSLGTLDAILNDPPTSPSVEQEIRLFVQYETLYHGALKSVEVEEYRSHLFVSLNAQDEGPDEGALPTDAGFAISDTPNGVTSFGYESLAMQTRTTEGGSPKVSGKLVYRGHGLWANRNVKVTSFNHALLDEEFTITEASLSFPTSSSPKYTLALGEPRVRLDQLVSEHEVPDGSITETKISDNAISTPKLQANAVTSTTIAADAITATKIAASAVTATKIAANAITSAKFATDAEAPEVRNSTGEVVIEPSGITVTNGKITVTNPGATVVIDGTSNMFKIASTGTLQTSSYTAPGSASANTTLALGFTYVPQILSSTEFNSLAGGYANFYVIWNTATGLVLDSFEVRSEVVSTNQTKVIAESKSARSGTQAARTYRYFVLKETAF